MGDVKVEEFASASDEDDYIFTVSVTGTGAEQVSDWHCTGHQLLS